MLDAMKRGAVSEYDSIKALNIYDMGDVINVLIDYHKDLDGLAKRIRRILRSRMPRIRIRTAIFCDDRTI